jgi:hypothetical protein
MSPKRKPDVQPREHECNRAKVGAPRPRWAEVHRLLRRARAYSPRAMTRDMLAQRGIGDPTVAGS